MAEWKAEWGNDPEREYGLVIEILEADDWRGRVERTDTGELVLYVYPTSKGIRVPAIWLSELLASAERDFPKKEKETE